MTSFNFGTPSQNFFPSVNVRKCPSLPRRRCPRRKCPRRRCPRRKCPRRKDVRGGSSSARGSDIRKIFSGGHFSSEQLRQFAAEAWRIRADPRGVRRSPPESGGRSADVRRSSLEKYFGGSSADPRGTGRSPRRKVFRRPYCPDLNFEK